jgi:hypothetical protein
VRGLSSSTVACCTSSTAFKQKHDFSVPAAFSRPSQRSCRCRGQVHPRKLRAKRYLILPCRFSFVAFFFLFPFRGVQSTGTRGSLLPERENSDPPFPALPCPALPCPPSKRRFDNNSNKLVWCALGYAGQGYVFFVLCGSDLTRLCFAQVPTNIDQLLLTIIHI